MPRILPGRTPRRGRCARAAGGGPAYPRTGTATACILVAASNTACRGAGAGMPSWSPGMDCPVPDHAAVWRAYGALDKG